MRSIILFLFVFVLANSAAQTPHDSGTDSKAHGGTASSNEPVTISIREGNELTTCVNPVWLDFYALTIAAFANGAANVDLPDYQQKTFALFRSSAMFAGADPKAVEDHIKDIPGQLVQIIKDDPKVLDSCENFSVALVGPP